MSDTRSGRMNTSRLELQVDMLKIKNKQSTNRCKVSKPSDGLKTTRSTSAMSLEVRRNSPTDKLPEQRPNTPNDKLTESGTKITATYPTPLLSLFPPVSQNGAIFGEEDTESIKSWKRQYRNARYLMERQKARYLALRKGKEKAVLCKECELTKGEKSLAGCKNSRKQTRNDKECDKTFFIEGHVVKESDAKHTLDSRAIPTNFCLSRMKTSFDDQSYRKQNKSIPTTGRRALSKISFEKLQPWVTQDKDTKRGLKMKQDSPRSVFSSLYLPHHC